MPYRYFIGEISFRRPLRNRLRFIPEHMEEDDETPKALPDWVELEYKVNCACDYANNDSNRFFIQHMRVLASFDSEVHFTNLSQPCADSLLRAFGTAPPETKIADVFCTTKGVLDLLHAIGVSLNQVCLLDPKADRELSPADTYTHFVFGVSVANKLSHLNRVLTLAKGILGNSSYKSRKP